MYQQSEQNLLSSNISSRSPYSMVNVGPLTAEIGSGVCGTPTNFNGFRALPSLLHRRRSTEVNQTLHNVWPSPGLVYIIYTLGVVSYILAALLHDTRAVARLCGVVSSRDRAAIVFDIGRPNCRVMHAALRNRAGHYIFALWFLSFFLSSFYLFYFLA